MCVRSVGDSSLLMTVVYLHVVCVRNVGDGEVEFVVAGFGLFMCWCMSKVLMVVLY